MKIGKLHIYFCLRRPGFIRPENGEGMWQLNLGIISITRMGKKSITSS